MDRERVTTEAKVQQKGDVTVQKDSDMPRHHAYVLRLWETRSHPPRPLFTVAF